MYVFSNTVKAESGKTLGVFSDHGAAMCAMYRQWNPNHMPLSGAIDLADMAEELEMKNRIRDLQLEGIEAV